MLAIRTVRLRRIRERPRHGRIRASDQHKSGSKAQRCSAMHIKSSGIVKAALSLPPRFVQQPPYKLAHIVLWVSAAENALAVNNEISRDLDKPS